MTTLCTQLHEMFVWFVTSISQSVISAHTVETTVRPDSLLNVHFTLFLFQRNTMLCVFPHICDKNSFCFIFRKCTIFSVIFFVSRIMSYVPQKPPLVSNLASDLLWCYHLVGTPVNKGKCGEMCSYKMYTKT